MSRWPLIAMENTLFSDASLDWEARCATVAAAGFDGIYAVPYPLTDDSFPRLQRITEVPSRHGLRLAGVYANIDLALPPEHPTNACVTRLFAEIEGAPGVELSFKCSSPDALPATPTDLDTAIAARMEPLLAIADRRGLKVALYPHSFYPLETPAYAARLIRDIGHPRLGYVFATSHVYAVSTPASVLAQLVAFAGAIRSFNVCGCRRSAPGPRAKCVHSPLDEGDLDLIPLWAALAAANYKGDIIVQGHGWSGDLPAMLRRCVVWHTELGLPGR